MVCFIDLQHLSRRRHGPKRRQPLKLYLYLNIRPEDGGDVDVLVLVVINNETSFIADLDIGTIHSIDHALILDSADIVVIAG